MKKFKRALITGASKGLGKEVATQLLLHCENLVLLGRDEPALINLKKDLKKNYAGEIDIFVVDLMNNEDLEQVKRFSKPVDLLINNAGLGFVNEFTRMSEENLKSMLLVNNYALTILTHHFANKMLQQSGGQIINISSAAAFLPIPYFSVYSATKSYVLSLSHALDIELKSKGVRVKALTPGGIKTNFHVYAGMDDQQVKKSESMMASAQDTAKSVISLIQDEQNALTPGAPNKVLQFLSWLLPSGVAAQLAAKTYKKHVH